MSVLPAFATRLTRNECKRSTTSWRHKKKNLLVPMAEKGHLKRPTRAQRELIQARGKSKSCTLQIAYCSFGWVIAIRYVAPRERNWKSNQIAKSVTSSPPGHGGSPHEYSPDIPLNPLQSAFVLFPWSFPSIPALKRPSASFRSVLCLLPCQSR